MTQNIGLCSWCGGLTWPGPFCRACARMHLEEHLAALDIPNETCDNGDTMITETLWNLMKHHASLATADPRLGPFQINLDRDQKDLGMIALGEVAQRMDRVTGGDIGYREATITGVVYTSQGHEYLLSVRVKIDW